MIDETIVARGLAPYVPSHLEVRTAPWTHDEDAEISFVDKASGATHVVRVQLGEGYACINVSIVETVQVGNATVSMVDGMLTKAEISPWKERDLGERLAAVFAEYGESYEPVRGPGVATHPLFERMWAAVNAALVDREDISLVVNGEESWAGKEEDVIRLVADDGTPLPISISTGAGKASVRNDDAGTVTDVHGFVNFGRVTDLVKGLLPPAPTSPSL